MSEQRLVKMLELDNVSKTIKYKLVVNGVSLRLEAGAILGVAGAANSGKSVLLRLMAGLVKPDSGIIRHNGINVEQSKDYRLRVGYASEQLYKELTILEYLQFCAAARGVKRGSRHQQIAQLLELAQIDHKTASSVLCRDLDKAMVKKVALLAAAVGEPEILLVDAPFAYLTMPQTEQMLEMLSQLHTPQRGIVLTSRSIGELNRISTELAIMRAGYLLVQGTQHDILRRIGAERRFYLKTVGADGRLIMVLRENPYVGEIEQKSGGYSFTFEGDENAQGQLLKEIIRRGYIVSEFRQEQTALEQEYIAFSEGLQW